MKKMRECLISSVRVSLINQDRIVVLKEKDQERYLPIWIGLYEFEAITIVLHKIETARPLTHDLMKNLFSVLDTRLISVEITALESDTFYANLVIEQGGAQKRVDCRPSDALALVVRTGVPVFVAEDVLDKASVIPELEIQLEEEETETSAQKLGDLSVFEEFFSKLDDSDTDEANPESKDDDPDLVP